MSENIEKYRALHDFVDNPAKKELFQDGGLFGSFRGGHQVLNIFAEYLDKLKKENKHIPVTVDSKNFIQYLAGQKKEENDDIDQLIKRIESLHQAGIIKDEPVAENTLYQFALILDDLNIIEKPESVVPRYDSSLEKVLELNRMGTMPTRVGGTENGVKSAENSTKQAENTTARPPIEQAETGAKPSENLKNQAETNIEAKKSEDTQTGITSESSEQISAQLPIQKKPEEFEKSQNPPNSQSQPTAGDQSEKLSPGRVPDLQNVSPGRRLTPVREKSKSNPLKDSGIFDETQEPKDIPETQSSGAFIQPNPATISAQSVRFVIPKKIRHVRGSKGLRKPTDSVQRIQDAPRKSEENGQNGQNQQSQSQSQADSAAQFQQNQPRNPSQAPQQKQNKKPNFAARLAKLAGAGITAGTILPLFSGGSAKAATFTATFLNLFQ